MRSHNPASAGRDALCAALLAAASAAQGQCDGTWITDMGLAGLDDTAWAVISWDQPGPDPVIAVIGGAFQNAGANPASRIVGWGDTGGGLGWIPIGSGANNAVLALGIFNGELVAGGNFTVAGGNAANHVARWTGATWQLLGGGLSGGVTGLWVFDGELIATGFFPGGVSRFNGAAWQDLSGGLNQGAYAATTYGQLVVGGTFTSAGAVPANRLALWNGMTWQEVGGGVGGNVFALTVYEGDLIVGGIFSQAGAIAASNVARWNGNSWSTLGAGANGPVYALTVYRDELIVGGAFSNAGGVSGTSRVARWHTPSAQWRAMTIGVSGNVNGLAVHDDQVFVVGSFVTAGGQPASRWARWQGGSAPTITTQPSDATSCPGGIAQFSVQSVANNPITYQWRHANTALINGGPISGADTDTLTITGVLAEHAGPYSCVLTSVCGVTVSNPADLFYCLANCDCSTTPPTLNVADFTCFLTRFAQQDPYANCDQSTQPPTLNVADFSCFLTKFAAGCP